MLEIIEKFFGRKMTVGQYTITSTKNNFYIVGKGLHFRANKNSEMENFNIYGNATITIKDRKLSFSGDGCSIRRIS